MALGSKLAFARFQISTSLGSNSSFLPSSLAFCLPSFLGALGRRQLITETETEVDGQTWGWRRTFDHLKPIVLELHRFQPLHRLLGATLLTTTLL